MVETPQTVLQDILTRAPVIPVITLEDVSTAVSVAKALVDGGLPALEITLRTPSAFDCIRAIVGEVENAIVGVGTVLTPDQFAAAARIGARFAVSPGITHRLLEAASDSDLPLLPGIATASEAMALIESGYRFAKFFPAEAAGGVAWLSSVASPLPQLKFCPTGGITPESAPRYLALPNVVCLGGSWIASRNRIAAQDWAGLKAVAQAAAGLRPAGV